VGEDLREDRVVEEKRRRKGLSRIPESLADNAWRRRCCRDEGGDGRGRKRSQGVYLAAGWAAAGGGR